MKAKSNTSTKRALIPKRGKSHSSLHQEYSQYAEEGSHLPLLGVGEVLAGHTAHFGAFSDQDRAPPVKATKTNGI